MTLEEKIGLKEKTTKVKEKAKEKLKKSKEKIKEQAKKIGSNIKKVKGKQIKKKLGFFSKMYFMIKKDLKLLLGSKFSAVVFLILPALVLLLVCFAFNTNVYNIKITTYAESYSNLTEEIIGNLSVGYVLEKSKTKEDCIEAVKFENSHVCAIFPKDLSIETSNESIEIYVDESRSDIANFISSQIKSKLRKKAKEIGMGFVEDIINVVEATSVTIVKEKSSINDIKSKIGQIKNRLRNIESDLSSIDFSYSLVNTQEIYDELEDLKDEENLSESDISDLKAKIENLKNAYNSLISKFGNVKSSVSNNKNELSNEISNIEINLKKFDEIHKDLQDLENEINNLKVKTPERIISPINMEVRSVSPKQSYIFYKFPSVIMFLLTFFGILMGSITVVREKISKAYFRTITAPTNDVWFILSAFLSNLIVTAIQIILMIGVALAFFKERYIMFGHSSVILLLVSSFFIFCGMLLGNIFSKEETAILFSICISSIFLFFSNTILPIETIANKTIALIVKFNPFVIGEKIVKWFVFFGWNYAIVKNYIFMLLSYIAIFFALCFIVRNINKYIAKKKGVY